MTTTRADRLDKILTERTNRCVEVEQVLLDAANGKRAPPDAAECRKLALRLGDPDSKPLPREPNAQCWRQAMIAIAHLSAVDTEFLDLIEARARELSR